MDRFCSYLLMGKLSGVNVLENSILGNVKTRRPVEVTDCTMDRGSSPFKIKFQKIQTFRTSEILSLKKIEQTDGGLARRQNNGDNKPFY